MHRAYVKYQWNGEDSRDIIFIGSIYGPNIEAVEFILSLAKTMPDFQFHIIGNVNTHGFPHKPGNVIFHGLVQDEERDNLFRNSCIALNPIFTGGGRNVKMIDYIMHGLPVISTETGIRGLDRYDLSGAVAVETPENFKDTISKLTGNRDKLKSMSENTFKLKEKILAAESSLNAYTIISEEYKK